MIQLPIDATRGIQVLVVFMLLPHHHSVAAAVPRIAFMLHSERRAEGTTPEVNSPSLLSEK